MTLVLAIFAIIPATASAKSCGSLGHEDIYGLTGPSCPVARSVANATERALLAGKLYRHTHYVLNVDSARWDLTSRFVTVKGGQVELYRATHDRQLVTFISEGSN